MAGPKISRNKPSKHIVGSNNAEPVEDVAVALELDFMQDLDIIANLELLEALVAMEEGTG